MGAQGHQCGRTCAQRSSGFGWERIPLDVLGGTYRIFETNRSGFGALFEGKVTTDKTWGHAFYGCMICCGYSGGVMAPDPAATFVGGYSRVDVTGTDDCSFTEDYITGYYQSWWSDNSSIASASFAEFHGLSAGTAQGSARGYIPLGSGGAGGNHTCPTLNDTASADVPVADFTLAAQTIKDGAQGNFAVTILSGTPSAYQWSYTSPNGAGNSPQVNFGSAASAQTTTDGRWFALPNQACTASNSSTYTIQAAVTFNQSGIVTKTTTLTVQADWSPAGYVDPNAADVSGGPTIGVDGAGVWRVINAGTLARVVPTSATIFVPVSSQFRSKAVQHENVHVGQWVAGTGHLFGDLYIAAGFYAQIQNITGISQQDLLSKLIQAKTTYVNGQGATYSSRLSQSEHDAYAVSDPIAPQYLYQNCGLYP